MSTRTVRLDEEAEKTLQRLRKSTGLSISEVLKRGMQSFEESAVREPAAPYEIYRQYDLGNGGWSKAPADQAKQTVRDLIRKKHKR
jgi:hypothetical protein